MSNFWLDIFTSGIDFNLPGNGGPDCLAQTTFSDRAVESMFSIITCTTAIVTGLKVGNLMIGDVSDVINRFLLNKIKV